MNPLHPLAKTIMSVFLMMILPFITLGGCTKKRAERFEQGQGIGLQAIKSLDGKIFSLTTGGYLATPNDTRSAHRKIDADSRGINQINLVTYKTDAKLLGDVPFRGKTDYKYEIHYEIGEKYLKILKVGAKRDIPYLERPYAKLLPNGRLAVPLVGYNIEGFYKTQKKKNSLGDETNIIIEVKLPSSKGATHVRVDYNSRQIFEALEKIDVYPSNLFQGEWYYSETVIDTSINKQQQDVGAYSVFEGFINNSAPTISFRKSEVDITAIKTNYDPKVNSDNEVNDLQVLIIPVEQWVDYRAVPEGKDSGLEEEKVFNRPWNKRKFMQVRFDRVESNLLANSGTASHSKTRLVDLEITSGYISFTLHQVDQRARVKYSFLRKGKRHYKARRSFKSDRDRFGFFDSTQERLLTEEDHYRIEDFEKYRKLNRFNPDKDIVWHFSRNSPAYARAAAKEAVRRWNAAFKLAGYKHKMYVSNEDVALGDIRYNVINLIDTVSVDRLLGFGPSTKDPETGEIISATTNIYLNSFKAGYFQSLRIYIEERVGIIRKQRIVDTFAPFGSVASKALPLTAPVLTAFSKPVLPRKAKLENVFPDTTHHDRSNVQPVKASGLEAVLNLNSPLSCQTAMRSSIVIDDFYLSLPTTCPEIADYIDRLTTAHSTDSSITSLLDEQQTLESCYQKLLYRPLVATILHEMGHNVGLRHNFRASTDAPNFYSEKNSQTPKPASSSVMDYGARHAEELQRPGKYDVAAIKFGYFDTLETESGTAVHIDPAQSITANQSRLGLDFKHYEFCTDSDVAMGIDPLCQRFDAGTTPAEIVDNYIQEFLIRFTNDRVRHSRVSSYNEDKENYEWTDGEVLGQYYASRYFSPIKRLYDEWRFKLRERIGPEQRYLETFDHDSYVQLLETFENEKWYQTYKPVADTVFKFFSELAFLQARTCVLENADGVLISIDFDIARRKSHSTWPQEQIRNCADIAANTNYFENLGLRFLAESGHPIKDFRFYGNPDYISGPIDVAGVESTRLLALFMLMQRDEAGQTSLLHQHFNFEPNFLDEPTYREIIERRLVRRILAGVDVKVSVPPGEGPLILEKQKHFQTESDLLIYSLNLFLKGIQIPSKPYETERRLTPYMTKFAREETDRQEAASSTILNNQHLVAFERNHVAVAFMTEFNRLQRLRSNSESLPEDPVAHIEDLTRFVATNADTLVDDAGRGSYFAFYHFMEGFSELLSNKPLFGNLFTSTAENAELSTEIAGQMAQIEQLVNDLMSTGATNEEVIAALKEHTFESPIAAGDFEKGLERTTAAMIDLLNQKANYEMFANDFNAQMNILRRGFSALAN